MSADPNQEPIEPRLSRLGMDVLTELAGATLLTPRAREFLFLRHGATDGNVEKIYQRFDQPLNEIGLAQAHEAADLLVGRGVERIRASDMARAWRTAEIAGAKLGLPVVAEILLRERWFGDLVGTSSAGLDWSHDPPNGDRLVDFIARTRDAVMKVLDTTERTLIVAHGGTLYVLAASLGVPLLAQHLHNASPLAFWHDGKSWQMAPLRPRTAEGLLAPS
jgi:probable phosphoglycerate mutase